MLTLFDKCHQKMLLSLDHRLLVKIYPDPFAEDLKENKAGVFFFIGPHQQTLEELLFLSSNVTAKNFIV